MIVYCAQPSVDSRLESAKGGATPQRFAAPCYPPQRKELGARAARSRSAGAAPAVHRELQAVSRCACLTLNVLKNHVNLSASSQNPSPAEKPQPLSPGRLDPSSGNRWDAQKFVLYLEARQFLFHLFGFLERNVRVGCPMNQYSGRIIHRDIAHRTMGIEPSRLNIRVTPRHFLRPDSLLAAI